MSAQWNPRLRDDISDALLNALPNPIAGDADPGDEAMPTHNLLRTLDLPPAREHRLAERERRHRRHAAHLNRRHARPVPPPAPLWQVIIAALVTTWERGRS